MTQILALIRNSCYSEIMQRKATISRCIFVIVFLALIAHPMHSKAGSAGEVPRISAADVEKLMDNPDVVIIDVRKKKSWWSSTTKIHGAVREDPSNVSQWIDKYPKTSTLIFYCD